MEWSGDKLYSEGNGDIRKLLFNVREINYRKNNIHVTAKPLADAKLKDPTRIARIG